MQEFFSILRSVLWGTPTAITDHTNWAALLNIAARQKCLHAFGMWAKTHRIKTPYDKKLHASLFLVMQRQTRLNLLTAEIINLLTKNNIPATLIKGYSLSCLYPDPDMREFGDVDIYVGEDNYQRAAQLVTEAYPNAHWHSDTHGGIHFILVLDESLDRVVELHRVTMEFASPTANTLYQAFTRSYLHDNTHSIEIYGTRVPIPSVTYNSLYVFMHAWHHFESTGVGFRQLGDWALCLHHTYQLLSNEEWQSLEQTIENILTALHMKTAWQTFGYLLVEQLHLPQQAFPLYTTRYQKRAKRLLRQILRDGHGARPLLFQRGCTTDISLMWRFPFERPQKNRCLQRSYTACRLLFEAFQLGKFFPKLAWNNLIASIRFKV